MELTAKFSAADMLAANNPIARATGIATDLAALELMANAKAASAGCSAPRSTRSAPAGGGGDATQPIRAMPIRA